MFTLTLDSIMEKLHIAEKQTVISQIIYLINWQLRLKTIWRNRLYTTTTTHLSLTINNQKGFK